MFSITQITVLNFHSKWKEHAKRVKGAVFYGMVNFETEKELVAEWVSVTLKKVIIY